MEVESILHTDEILRKHGLLVRQRGFGETARFDVVDALSLCPASRERLAEYDAEAL